MSSLKPSQNKDRTRMRAIALWMVVIALAGFLTGALIARQRASHEEPETKSEVTIDLTGTAQALGQTLTATITVSTTKSAATTVVPTALPTSKGTEPAGQSTAAPAVVQGKTPTQPTPGKAEVNAQSIPLISVCDTPPERVLLISVDGLSADMMDLVPALNELAQNGAYTWNAHTVVTPTLRVAYASMLTGVTPEKHGIKDVGGTLQVPSVFQHLKNNFPDRVVVLQVGDPDLSPYNHSDYSDFYYQRNAADDTDNEDDIDISQRVANKAKWHLNNTDFDLMFLHFPEAGQAGQVYGYEHRVYREKIRDIDNEINILLDKLTKNSLTESTLIIVTTAFSGDVPDDPGLASLGDIVPFILHGPCVKQGNEEGGYQIDSKVSVMDVTGTILWVFGIYPEDGLAGGPVTEAFELKR